MDDSEYGNLNNEDRRINHANRRLERVLSSLSYRTGKVIIDSIKRPWKLVILPFALIYLGYVYSMERLGRRPGFSGGPNNFEYEPRECAVLFPTNGVGMGHMSRMVALARSIQRLRPSMEIVFFTTNYVIHHLYQKGFTCYHLPGRKKFSDMSPSEWNSICEDKLTDVIELHRPSYFIFDGTYPYRGMLNAIKGRKVIHKVWVKRSGDKGKVNPPPDSYSHFDRMIIPDDFIEKDGQTMLEIPVNEINTCPPMISVSRHDLFPRGGLRGRLGIPEDATVCLLALGAGVINETSNLRSFVSDNLSQRGVYAIIADSMLNPTNDFSNDPYVRIVREYPIMQYRNCFDFAMITGGYNSVHEAVFLRLPSIIIPNNNTLNDDQRSRSLNAADKGGFMVVEEEDFDLLELAIDRICDEDVRLEMINSMISEEKITDGAPFVAEALIAIQR